MNIFSLRTQFDKHLKGQVWKPSGAVDGQQLSARLAERHEAEAEAEAEREREREGECEDGAGGRGRDACAGGLLSHSLELKAKNSERKPPPRAPSELLHNRWYIPKAQWFKKKPDLSAQKLVRAKRKKHSESEDEQEEEEEEEQEQEQEQAERETTLRLRGFHKSGKARGGGVGEGGRRSEQELPYYRLKRSLDAEIEGVRGLKEVAAVAKMFREKVVQERGRVPHCVAEVARGGGGGGGVGL